MQFGNHGSEYAVGSATQLRMRASADFAAVASLTHARRWTEIDVATEQAGSLAPRAGLRSLVND
eukprot:4865447-Alexandrium_andersonii.AAC.1